MGKEILVPCLDVINKSSSFSCLVLEIWSFTVYFSGKRRSLLHPNTAQGSFLPLQSYSKKTLSLYNKGVLPFCEPYVRLMPQRQERAPFIIISEVQTVGGEGEQRDKHGNEKFSGKSQNKNKLKCFFIPVLFICSISETTSTGFTCCQWPWVTMA